MDSISSPAPTRLPISPIQQQAMRSVKAFALPKYLPSSGRSRRLETRHIASEICSPDDGARSADVAETKCTNSHRKVHRRHRHNIKHAPDFGWHIFEKSAISTYHARDKCSLRLNCRRFGFNLNQLSGHAGGLAKVY